MTAIAPRTLVPLGRAACARGEGVVDVDLGGWEKEGGPSLPLLYAGRWRGRVAPAIAAIVIHETTRATPNAAAAPSNRATQHRARASAIRHSIGARGRSRALGSDSSCGGLGDRVSTRWHTGMASVAACGPAPIAAPVSGAASVDDSLLLAARSCVVGWGGAALRLLGCSGLGASAGVGTKQETQASLGVPAHRKLAASSL